VNVDVWNSCSCERSLNRRGSYFTHLIDEHGIGQGPDDLRQCTDPRVDRPRTPQKETFSSHQVRGRLVFILLEFFLLGIVLQPTAADWPLASYLRGVLATAAFQEAMRSGQVTLQASSASVCLAHGLA